MKPNDSYLPLDSQAAPTEASAPSSVSQFLTLCVLGARDEVGFPSNERGFDEDVNVYLVGLLEAFLGAGYHERAARYLHRTDLDLAREVRRRGDERHSYSVYKLNADHLLLAIGLLDRIEGNPAVGPFRREPREFLGRGSTYYHLASSSLRRLQRRATATELAMTKLGHGFESYADVLRRVRSSYFHLTTRLGEGSLFHLERDGERQLAKKSRAELYDLFLDAYSAWRNARDEASYADLAEAVEGLREVDEEFAFRMPDPPSAN